MFRSRFPTKLAVVFMTAGHSAGGRSSRHPPVCIDVSYAGIRQCGLGPRVGVVTNLLAEMGYPVFWLRAMLACFVIEKGGTKLRGRVYVIGHGDTK
jgi:hypothetical protein